MPNASRLAGMIGERERVLRVFLEAEKGPLALCCHALARAFARGGTLLPFGTGAAATDAAHVAVEFMHPVIVGKRAFPALAPTNDPTGASTLERLARPGDIALGIVHGADDAAVREFLDAAGRHGLLTIALWGPGDPPNVDFPFVVACDDEHIVQEVQETAYHVLWELVHVFFEHPGLLADSCITCGDTAVRGRVLEVRGLTAVVDVDGLHEEIAIDLLEDGVAEGDSVLCHAGVALERLA